MLMQLLLQSCVNVCLIPESTPQQEGGGKQADGHNFPHRTLVLAPH